MYREPRSLGSVQRLAGWLAHLHRCLRPATANPERRALAMQVVGFAARRLEFSDFALFEMAYRSWYGAQPPHAELEHVFGQCLMLRRDLPFYVRRYLGRIGTLAA